MPFDLSLVHFDVLACLQITPIKQHAYYAVRDVRSSYVNTLLVNEWQVATGFKESIEKNKSQLLYDVAGGGDYIESAIFSLGISDDQLLENGSPRLSKKIRDI